MHVLEQLEQDLAAAMRERDQIRLQVLRLLKSALKNYQIVHMASLAAQCSLKK